MGALTSGINEGVVRGRIKAASIPLPGWTKLIRHQMHFGGDGAACLGELRGQGVRQ